MVNADDEQNWAYLLAPTFQCVNTSGKPLTEGYIEVYIHGTRNKYYCAKDFDGTLHPFQIPLDSLGANIVLAQPLYSYDVYVYNKYNSLQMSRYNVKPHTDVGEAIAQLVDIQSSDNTVSIERESATGWNLSIKDTVDRVQDIENALDGFKTKQDEISESGSVTKTITNIQQNENGEISVTYEDIDLPPQVPNVEITSPNDSISISSSTDQETNIKTFEIDVKSSGMQYFDGYNGKSHYEYRDPGDIEAFGLYVDQWAEYEYKGDFITNNWQLTDNSNINLKPGVYLIHAAIAYNANNTWSDPDNPNPTKDEGDGYIRIATGAYNGLEDGTRYKDWSHEYQMSENSIQMTFVRTVLPYDNTKPYISDNDLLYFYPYLPWGINYAKLDHLQIVKLDSAIAQIGSTYSAGNGIYINDQNVISVKEGAGLGFAGDTLKVNAGSGISIINDELCVNVGSGITIEGDKIIISEDFITNIINNEIQTIPGDGLSMDEDNKLNVNVDKGLSIDGDNYINVNIGTGIYLNEDNELCASGDQAIVNAGSGLSVDGDNYLNVNAGSGLSIDEDNNINVNVGSGLQIINGDIITINPEVGDVVATVEKLKKDLDTQITVNFDMPNVTHTYDFTDRSVSTLTNGATMLCQAFTIPINHDIRVATLDEDEPTLLGIYAKQQFNYKIMLALYVYDFETGYTDYVGDTGPVYVDSGRNEYPLVHKNPNINELTSSCVYYASLYLPSNSQVNGLYLASCPSYSNASYINAIPRFTVGVENITYNNSEIDMTDATTGRLDYNDGQGNYYIGPWTDSYNERPAAPRFFMQVRNGTPTEHYEPTNPFTTLGVAAMVTNADTASNLPNFTLSSNNSCFRDVTPDADCDITYFEWLDDTSSAAGWAQSNCVYNSGFDTNLSGQNNVVTNIGQETTIDGHNVYRHRITFGTALHLTANTTYRFLCECFTDTSYVFSRSSNTNTIHVTSNGWYVDLNNMTRYNNIIGKYLKVCADGTDYEI